MRRPPRFGSSRTPDVFSPVMARNTSSRLGRWVPMCAMPKPREPSSADDGGQLLVAEDRYVQQALVGDGRARRRLRRVRPRRAPAPSRAAAPGRPGRICRVRPPTFALSSSTRPLGDDPPAVDDGELVRELLGLFHVLGGEQDGRTLGDHPLDLVPDLVAGPGVESGRRLVQVEHGRLPDHRGGQVETAPHSAGVLHRGPLGGVGEREAFQHLVGAAAGGLARQIEQPPDHVEVLPAGELLVDRGVLPGESDGAAQLPRLLHHVVTGDEGGAGVRGAPGWRGSVRAWSCRRRWARAHRARCPRGRPGPRRPVPWSRRSA